MKKPKAQLNIKGLFAKLRPRPFEPEHLFLLGILFCTAFCFLYYLCRSSVTFGEMFFSNGNDMFMDFFNSVRDASRWAAVYTERKVIYPPMANLLFLIFSGFLPAEYNGTPFWARKNWMEVPAAFLLVFLVFFLLMLLLYILLRENVKLSRKYSIAFALCAVFSFPVIFCVERGNIIFLSFLAVLIFALTYHSENRVYREIGLLALAFSFSLKLYPVLFGYFLLTDKRYKDAARCAVYGLLMLVIPSFFFGGPMCLVTMVQNVLSFSDPGNHESFTTYVSSLLHINATVLSLIFYAWCLCCALALLSAPFIYRDKPWKFWLLGCLLILTVPSLTSPYSYLFVFVPLLLLINDKNSRQRSDWFYAAVMIVPFLPLPKLTPASPNVVTVYLATAVLSVALVIETAKKFFAERKNKKSAKTAAGE